MPQTHCGGCGERVHRTHNCRASVTRNQPDQPTPRPAAFWQWVEEARHDAQVDQLVASTEQLTLDVCCSCPCRCRPNGLILETWRCHLHGVATCRCGAECEDDAEAWDAAQNRGGRP